MNRYEKILKNISGKRIAVIGDVMIDCYLWGSAERISPEAPVPVVFVSKKEMRPGGAANVALNLKSLGVEPQLFSVIGKDANGKILSNLLNESGIKTETVFLSSQRITTSKTRVLSQNHQMLRFDEELKSPVTETDSAKIISSFCNLNRKKKFDAVIIEDYNKGLLSPELIETLLIIFDKEKIPVLVDPKHDNFFEYEGVTVFKPNLREAQQALGKNIESNLSSLNQAHAELKNKLSHHYTLITLGDKGSYIHNGKSGKIIPAQIRNVSDVSGAGDTVIAVMAGAMTAGATLTEATFLSNLAGGLVCEKAGVVAIDRLELLNEIKSLSK